MNTKEKKYRINFKRLALVVGVLVISALLLQSCIIACGRSAKASDVQESERQAFREIIVSGRPSGIRNPESEILPNGQAIPIRVYDHKSETVISMDLEEYLIGVVAGEMPGSFAPEALKAQAVASRTYSVYGIRRGGCGTCKEADICTNSQCCQAYAPKEDARISGAVQATAGEVMLCEGKVIEALYHGSAGGMTEDSEHVFAASRPYLRAVESANEIGSRQEGEVRVPKAEFIKKANAAYPKAELDAANLVRMVRVLERYESGRVKSMLLGGATVTGKQCRKLFELNSTQFAIAFTENEVIFTTKGYGHGVGMSQAGANGLAQSGSNYREILLHYYTGVTINALTPDP